MLLGHRVTGRPAADEIHRRILRPLGLRNTYFPGTEPRIAGPHSLGCVPWPDGELRDFSVYNMSWAQMVGELLSTTADPDRFYRVLLGGRLLRTAELAQMRDFLPTEPTQPGGLRYGLGLLALPLWCGDAWGHDGLVLGHSTISLHSPDGRQQVTIASNVTHYQYPGPPDPIGQAMFEFISIALCGPVAADSPAVRTATTHTLPLTPAPGIWPAPNWYGDPVS
jgi:D-alanyl-D-alanine carboxypeptidase